MAGASIGAQLYTVREFTKTERDIAETFRKLRGAGFSAVQVSAMGVSDATVIRRLLDDQGLTCAATHLGADKFRNDLPWVVDYHLALGCRHTAIGSMPQDERTGEGYRRFAVEFSRIATELKRHGLTFSYHNHSFEFERFEGGSGLDLLLRHGAADAFFLEIDTYWIRHGGGDPAAWIRKAAGRVPLLHVKDMKTGADGGPVMAEVGTGELNWPGILEAAAAAGVEWLLIEQDICPGDPFESLATSLANLKRMTGA